MEVDHFNPRLKKTPKQNYNNLFLATRTCNGTKGEFWPSQSDRRQGIRLLNPCKETEFPEHIVEDPKTGKLKGLTPAGKMHIRVMGLNDPMLIQHRQKRRQFRELLKKSDGFIILKADANLASCGAALTALTEHIDKMIMDLPTC